MKAISLWQPWASLVVLGEKKIETRDWDTKYRGPLLIHAAKRQDLPELKELMENYPYFAESLGMNFHEAIAKLPYGALIGKVDFVGIRQTCAIQCCDKERTFGNYADGRLGWILENPVLFEHPVAYKGAQRLFDVPCEIIGNTLNLLEVQR